MIASTCKVAFAVLCTLALNLAAASISGVLTTDGCEDKHIVVEATFTENGTLCNNLPEDGFRLRFGQTAFCPAADGDDPFSYDECTALDDDPEGSASGTATALASACEACGFAGEHSKTLATAVAAVTAGLSVVDLLELKLSLALLAALVRATASIVVSVLTGAWLVCYFTAVTTIKSDLETQCNPDGTGTITGSDRLGPRGKAVIALLTVVLVMAAFGTWKSRVLGDWRDDLRDASARRKARGKAKKAASERRVAEIEQQAATERHLAAMARANTASLHAVSIDASATSSSIVSPDSSQSGLAPNEAAF